MREIKFRAWDKKRDEMEYFDLGHKDGLLYACGEWQVATGYDSEDNPTFDDDNVPCRYELMQFTGLHDKDGKEIYEGDILSPVVMHTDDITCFDIGIVRWLEGGFWVCRINAEQFHEELYLVCDRTSVIGNIYENPELLNND